MGCRYMIADSQNEPLCRTPPSGGCGCWTAG